VLPERESVRLDLDAESLEVLDVPGEDRFVDDLGGRPDDDVPVADRVPVVRLIAGEPPCFRSTAVSAGRTGFDASTVSIRSRSASRWSDRATP
jgi:hypothetical protein